MTPETLRDLPDPSGLPTSLQALWHEARGDWECAHRLAQESASPAGDWVHAYLHRKEGDLGNAGYWYRRAGKPIPAATMSFETEWRDLVVAIWAESSPGS